MLPSTARRVLSSASQSSAVSSLSSSSPRAALSQALTIRSHQRRYSSSKPSKPADGPKRLDKEQVATAGTESTSKSPRARSYETKKSSQSKRRNSSGAASAKAAVPEAVPVFEVPRVPTAQDLAYNDVAVSSFFARHRPIALTKKIPGPVSQESFAALFDGSAAAAAAAPQFSSPVVTTIFNQTARIDPSQILRKDDTSARSQDIESLFANISVSKEYLPFTPPAAPEPMSAGIELLEQVEIEEPSVAVKYNPMRRRASMWAISVKRQRKLKMKKHKYKKLMKKTRNLRRRQDRA